MTEKKPFYKKWWFWLIVVILAIGVLGTGEESQTEEDTSQETSEPVIEEEEIEEEEEEPEKVEETATEEETEETQNEDGLSEEELNALEDGLEQELEDDLYIHSFEYEDNQIEVWVDMQMDPLPTKIEAEDILAGITWYLAELNDVVEDPDYDVNALLISNVDGGMMHWLTERYRDGEYDMQEEDAFEILPD